MTTKRSTICRSVATATRRFPVPRLGLLALAVVCVSTNIAQAVQYDFLSVSGNWPLTGNASSTTFTSNYGNGTITVSHVFSSPAAVGYADNDNALLFPSAFPINFPGTGQVQGHLAMTVYGDPNGPMPGGNINSSQVIFTLNYTGSLPDLVFGMWNTTSEVLQPAYRVELIDVNSNPQQPSMLNLIGNEDNVGAAGVPGRYDMVMNPNGDIVLGAQINAGGTHTNAAFWDNIPAGTQQIIVYGNLPPLNTIGDGVGYYFAEIVPEPSSFVLGALGLIGLAVLGWRRRQR